MRKMEVNYAFDVHGTMRRLCIPLSVTNKMQRYTIFFIAVEALQCFRRFFRPSSGAQTVHTASSICQACLLLSLAWVSWQFELLMMGGKPD